MVSNNSVMSTSCLVKLSASPLLPSRAPLAKHAGVRSKNPDTTDFINFLCNIYSSVALVGNLKSL